MMISELELAIADRIKALKLKMNVPEFSHGLSAVIEKLNQDVQAYGAKYGVVLHVTSTFQIEKAKKSRRS